MTPTHGTEVEMAHDAARSDYLRQMGFRIFRAHNFDIRENLNGVLDTLLAYIEKQAAGGDVELVAAPHPGPLPIAKGDGERE